MALVPQQEEGVPVAGDEEEGLLEPRIEANEPGEVGEVLAVAVDGEVGPAVGVHAGAGSLDAARVFGGGLAPVGRLCGAAEFGPVNLNEPGHAEARRRLSSRTPQVLARQAESELGVEPDRWRLEWQAGEAEEVAAVAVDRRDLRLGPLGRIEDEGGQVLDRAVSRLRPEVDAARARRRGRAGRSRRGS